MGARYQSLNGQHLRASIGCSGSSKPGQRVNPAYVPSPWVLLTATAAIVAFHFGFLTLVGRERKSPYVINLLFPIFIACLVVAALSISSPLIPSPWVEAQLLLATVVLWIAVLISLLQVYRIALRFLYFVDSIHVKHLPGVRHIRRWYSMRSARPAYAHNPLAVSTGFTDMLTEILKTRSGVVDFRTSEFPKTLAIAVDHYSQADGLLGELALVFLREKFTVQYMSASRHPVEWIEYLRRRARSFTQPIEDWHILARHVVAVDAYSAHFAFLDSIYLKKDQTLDALNVSRVRSQMTYAGIHSAASRAFNLVRQQSSSGDRLPTLVIYEGSYALSDLESPEQYRIFVRHVVPSERMWDAMLTVFVECGQAAADWRVLQGYADVCLDLAATTSERHQVQETRR